MVMRNFWIEGTVDGRESKITGGSRLREGGFNLDVFMRDNGESVKGVNVRGWEENGKLHLGVWVDGQPVYKRETDR